MLILVIFLSSSFSETVTKRGANEFLARASRASNLGGFEGGCPIDSIYTVSGFSQ